MRADEFPADAAEWPEELSRRDFIRLTSASLALAGLGGCTKQPIERIVPYIKQPEEVIPGKPLRFASATTFNGYAQGILVISREGRPIKIEGNPDHPASLGATTIWAQADLLDLYDPDRAQAVMREQNISTWADFIRDVDLALAAQQSAGGAGLRILTETITSPTLRAQLDAVLKKFPDARCHQWNPIGANPTAPLHDLSKVKVIVALDSDFLFIHPAALRYARDFSARRRVAESSAADMCRLYAAEPTPTITGSNADHRIAIAARDIRGLAEQIMVRIKGAASSAIPDRLAPFAGWVDAVAGDLVANRGASVIIAGETQPPEVHELVKQIDADLGNATSTSTFSPGEPNASLRDLVESIKVGAVEMLLIVGGNPVYTAPADFDLALCLSKVKWCAQHTLHLNETSRQCQWVVPASHFLESWSDSVAVNGAVSIVQPLIEPLYATVSVHEFIGSLIERPVRSSYEIVRETWRTRNPGATFETEWRRALSDGVFQDADLAARPKPSAAAVSLPNSTENAPSDELEILFRADPNVLDGRYTNNGWLQELPRPFTKLTWENAALVSPALAARKNLDQGDIVELTFRNRKLMAPVWIQPGQAENSVTLHLGYGRKVAGHVGNGAGFNAYALRTSDALWFGHGLAMRKTREKHSFASTQGHREMEGRDFLRSGSVAQFTEHPDAIARRDNEPKQGETLYDPDEFKNSGYAWGMVIDLGTCIGCSACTIACQAENNIPVVGKEQVARGREMHWIRVDTYLSDKIDPPLGAVAVVNDNLRFEHQPVPCMHCEHAPCELVCPVAATVHDAEGLNLQIYNRCIGTRYCSNNCPYKVRRFNFIELNGNLSPTEKLGKNPEVSIRSRGVMEKCTYCVQRINAARVTAELENRRIRDGEIVPACAQVCPTEAIVFGDIHDPNSRVSKLKGSPLNYAMLAELNTRPRTTYLARVNNPNSAFIRP
jgi:molybdopterin-containing oxidoreductase family iron-sulfur binding subunit